MKQEAPKFDPSKHAKDFMEWSTQTEKICHACEVEKLTGIVVEGNVHVCDPIAAGFTEHIDWPPRKKK